MKKAVFYLLTILIATVLPLTLAEVLLRFSFGGGGLSETALRERLARSEEASVTEARSLTSLFGLVRPSAHHDVIYELKPDLDVVFRDEPLQTNSHGLRSGEYGLEKPAGTVRIVGLGDSHMFGWRVAQGEAYLDHVERGLNAAGDGRRFEALNCAAPGYNTTMEVAIFEHKCAAFAPDLVVVHFVGNDFSLPRFLQPPRGAAPSRWYVVELVRAAFAGRGEDDEGLVANNKEMTEEEWEEVAGPYRHMVGEKGYRRAMARLAELTTARGVPVLVVMVGERKSRELALAVAEEHGFETLNLAPRLGEYLAEKVRSEPSKKDWKRTFQFAGSDNHPNALAHRLYAETLVERVREIFAGRPEPESG